VKTRVAIVGPVYPYRAGIAYCTTRLAEELSKSCDVSIVSFKRQYPKRFYPGGNDVDETLRDRTPANARFDLDVLNPLTWISAGVSLRRYDAVVLVWWIWVWALPYVVMMTLLRRRQTVVLQCHNIGDKEPAKWKSWLTNRVLRRGDALVVHAEPELVAAVKRSRGRRIVKAHLPVHQLGGAIPDRKSAKEKLGLAGRNVALFFGHVRPFKALDIALTAWPKLQSDVVLLVAGEAWWEGEQEYKAMAAGLENVRLEFRFIPDAEIATYFAAADVVLAPYRIEAQSGVALTAFHFGRPVIATRVGGLPEIVRDGVNGSLVPPEDPDALAAAIDFFFTRSDRALMEKGAAASARANSWEDYAKVFRSLVSQP
jgi:glycosyltransferase involved in cell wall biosynthesis